MPLFSINEGGGGQRFCCVTEGWDILLTLRTVTMGRGGGGRGKFSPKTELRNV